MRVVGLLHVVSIPALALALRELEAAGKVSPDELRSMASPRRNPHAAGGLLLHRAFHRLRPRARRLEALLADYR